MNDLSQHQRLVLQRARGGWKTQRQLQTSRITISILIALGLLARKIIPGRDKARPENYETRYKATGAR